MSPSFAQTEEPLPFETPPSLFWNEENSSLREIPSEETFSEESLTTISLPPDFVGPAIFPRTVEEGEEDIAALTDPGKVIIEFPVPGEIVRQHDVEIFIRTEGGTTNPAENTFHVFLDNDAPIVHEDERRPIVLRGLSEGGHIVRVLCVHRNGDALPLPDSYAVVRFFVKRKDFRNFVDTNKPYLTINKPFNGLVAKDDQGRVCFDFFIHNAKLSKKGYRLRYLLDNKKHIVTEPGPVYWSNLAPGLHSLLVDLVDSSGNPVMGLFNRVERNFELAQVLRPLLPESEESQNWEQEGDFYLDEFDGETLF